MQVCGRYVHGGRAGMSMSNCVRTTPASTAALTHTGEPLQTEDHDCRMIIHTAAQGLVGFGPPYLRGVRWPSAAAPLQGPPVVQPTAPRAVVLRAVERAGQRVVQPGGLGLGWVGLGAGWGWVGCRVGCRDF